MSRIIFGLLLFLSIFAQATLVPAINPFNVAPDGALLLLLLWTGYCGPREALGWTFVAGITLDILSADPLGTNAVALALGVVVLASLLRERLYGPFPIVMIAAVVATIAHGVLLSLLRGSLPTATILWQAMAHALIVLIPYVFMRRIARDD